MRAIKGMPKAELHIHILGAIRPRTLLEFTNEAGIETGFNSKEEMRQFFQYRNFSHFIEIYNVIINTMTREKQFERLAFEVLEDLDVQNVVYAELSFSSRDHVKKGLDFDDMIDAINRGIRKARKQFGIDANIRIDLVRNEGPEKAMETLDSIEMKPDNIVSVDIGGSEDRFPPAPFKDVYERAKSLGLHLVAHAGEAMGPSSIWDALNYLDVERIGHAVSAMHDPELVEYLRKNEIVIEACPMSNVRTGAVSSINEHPVKEFFDRGLLVTINSDDPTLFGTNLNNELVQLHQRLDFSIPDILQVMHNAIEAAFLPANKKDILQRRFNTYVEESMHLQ